jgi:hypothetical protein
MLKELPMFSGELITLEQLTMSTCGELKELPTFIDQLINLEYFNLFACSKLKELLKSIG